MKNAITTIDSKALLRMKNRSGNHLLSEEHIYHVFTDRLLERLDYIRVAPETILTMGWHIQHSKARLDKKYPYATIKTAHDSAEISDFSNESIDLIILNFSLLRDFEPLYLLQECHRILKIEGLLLLTSLGPDTFYELRQSFHAVDATPHVHDFVDMHHVGDWLRGLRFENPVVDREEITVAYDTLELFFDDLKKIQATNAHTLRARGLMTQRQWQRMMVHYAQLKTDAAFPVTVEMIYGHGWKVKGEEDEFSEFTISVEQIKRKG